MPHRIAGHQQPLLDGAAPLPTGLSRVRGGTFSATVSRTYFTDGTSALTDLVRLNPNIDAYSVDFSGQSPRHLSRYRGTEWSDAQAPTIRGGERAITAILLGSYPTLDTAALSKRLRDAGYPLGRADLAEHEAIAATQAALWHITDGLDLDCTARNVPTDVSVRDAVGTVPHAVSSTGIAPVQARGDGTLAVTASFAGEPQLDAYTVHLPADAPSDLTWSLAASRDGVIWNEVPSSRAGLRVHGERTADGWRVAKGLGAGATLSRSSNGKTHGYRHYRVTFAANSAAAPIAVNHLGFALADSERATNSERIVHLYRYLVQLAQAARTTSGVAVRGPRDLVNPGEGRVFGPFSVDPSDVDSFTPRVSGGWAVTDRHGLPLTRPLTGGEQFYVTWAAPSGRDDARSGRIELTVDVHVGWTHRGVLLVGSSTADGAAEFTTLALVGRTPSPDATVSATLRWRAQR